MAAEGGTTDFRAAEASHTMRARCAALTGFGSPAETSTAELRTADAVDVVVGAGARPTAFPLAGVTAGPVSGRGLRSPAPPP